MHTIITDEVDALTPLQSTVAKGPEKVGAAERVSAFVLDAAWTRSLLSRLVGSLLLVIESQLLSHLEYRPFLDCTQTDVTHLFGVSHKGSMQIQMVASEFLGFTTPSQTKLRPSHFHHPTLRKSAAAIGTARCSWWSPPPPRTAERWRLPWTLDWLVRKGVAG